MRRWDSEALSLRLMRRSSINVNGLRMALQSLGIQLSVEICNQLFLKHDADRSGSIQLNEFIEIEKEVRQWVVGDVSWR